MNVEVIENSGDTLHYFLLNYFFPNGGPGCSGCLFHVLNVVQPLLLAGKMTAVGQ